MTQVSIRELRNHGGEVVDRAAAGERVTITRNGKEVAELRPIGGRGVSPEAFRFRRRHLPRLDPEALRADLDSVIDPSM